MLSHSPPLLLITDRKYSKLPLGEVTEEAFAAGCRWLMVREKGMPSDRLAELVDQLAEVGRRYHASILVNGDARVAAECGAQGVHLPQGYSVAKSRSVVGKKSLIGVSAHSLAEAQKAERDGADYVTLSPVFPTISKSLEGPPLGLKGFEDVAAGISIPVLALGGVTPMNAVDCLRARAVGVAVIGSVMGSERPGDVVREYVRRLAAYESRAERQDSAH